MLRIGRSTSDELERPIPAPPPPDRHRSRGALVERIAGWSVRHRTLAIGGWFALVVLAVLASALMPGETANSTDPGESGRAQRVIRAQQAEVPVQESVLIQARTPGGPRLVDDPALRRAVEDLVTTLRRTPTAITDVRSPLEPAGALSAAGGDGLVSRDGRSGLVIFQVPVTEEAFTANYATAVKAVDAVQDRHPEVRVAQAGEKSLNSAVDQRIKADFQRSEYLSGPLTLVILLLVFGSLIAAGIPVLLTVTAMVGAFGLIGVISHWIPVNSAVSSMLLLVGVAVGIDYSLFYLRREREERAAGRDVAEALRIAARTSGRVVVVSGLTVMLCLSGLLLSGLDTFRGLTVGTTLVVGLAMLGSVTVLPAVLAVLGRWVDRGRIPWLGRRRTAARESRAWSAIAGAVVRRPVLWGGLAVLGLLLAALPAVGMRLQDAAITNSLPRSVPEVDAAIRMQEAFPGAPTPARVVIWRTGGGAADSPAVRGAIEELRDRAGVDALVTVVKVDQALVVRVPLAGSGTDPASNRALAELRDEALPATLGRVDGIDYAVAGKTAWAKDFADRLSSRTPYIFGFVLLLAFVLLAVAFRSVSIPLVSIVLNLLSVGAAYGVLTWVFQDGHLEGPLGFTAYGGVVGWLPLFMFVLLFGLSMDYHIFILSRIRERWSAGASAREAIVGGIGSSAGVVTSAAVIMTAVFGVFVALTAIEQKMLGVGMAVAVIIDATVVRGVLLPAAMAMLGERAWSVPRWLRWLPEHRAS